MDIQRVGHGGFWRLGSPKELLFKEWREIVAEFLGTLFYVFFGTGALVSIVQMGGLGAFSSVAMSLAMGFTVMAIVFGCRKVGGGYLNPALTLGALVSMKIDFVKAVAFVLAQLIGAVAGSACLLAALPSPLTSALDFGGTGLAKGVYVLGGSTAANTTYGNREYSVSLTNGMALEIVLTFTLVISVFSTSTKPIGSSTTYPKVNYAEYLGPIVYGSVTIIAHLVGAPFTGPSLNPARSFGPAVWSGFWDNHWVFWIGPLVGAILGALVHQHILLHAETEENYNDSAD